MKTSKGKTNINVIWGNRIRGRNNHKIHYDAIWQSKRIEILKEKYHRAEKVTGQIQASSSK